MEESQIQQGAGKHHQALRQFFLYYTFFITHTYNICISASYKSPKCLPFAPIIIIDGGYKNMDKTLCDLLLSVYNFRILP